MDKLSVIRCVGEQILQCVCALHRSLVFQLYSYTSRPNRSVLLMQPPERTEIRTHSLTHFSIIAAFFFLSFFCCFLLTFCLVGLSNSHTNFVLLSLDQLLQINTSQPQFSLSPIIYWNPSCPFFFFLVLIVLSGKHRFIYADIGVVSSACPENRR